MNTKQKVGSMQKLKEGADWVLTGWRLGFGLVVATVGIMGFLYDIKLSIAHLSGKVNAYHTMVQTISNENDDIIEDVDHHLEQGGHREMEVRMKAVERKLGMN